MFRKDITSTFHGIEHLKQQSHRSHNFCCFIFVQNDKFWLNTDNYGTYCILCSLTLFYLFAFLWKAIEKVFPASLLSCQHVKINYFSCSRARMLFLKNAMESWNKLHHFSRARNSIHCLYVKKHHHHFSRIFPKLNSNEALYKEIVFIHMHTDSLS